jgi:uncharacterized protein (UPF0335 family)
MMKNDEVSSAVLVKEREDLAAKADKLRHEAEELREEARDLDAEARLLEHDAEAIESILRARGGLFDPEHAALWGREIAAAIYDGRQQIHFRMLDSDWLSNGHIAWRVDAVPGGWRPSTSGYAGRDELGKEVSADRHPIDLASPVASGVSNGHTYSDFNVAGLGLLRFRDDYWRAVQASGDEVGVTMPTMCLAAYREGKPTAIAMRIKA